MAIVQRGDLNGKSVEYLVISAKVYRETGRISEIEGTTPIGSYSIDGIDFYTI